MASVTRGLATAVVLGCLGSAGAFEEGIYIGQEDACTCLTWKEAYDNGQVECGKSLEYFLATKKGASGPAAAKALGDEFCNKFFTRIKTNFCVNVDFTQKPKGWKGIADKQWCYVSSACESLNGGFAVKGYNVSAKACVASDNRTRVMLPEQLDAIRGSQGLDLGLLAKYSYPIWQEARWPELERFFIGDKAASSRQEAGRHDLDEVIAAGEPILFDSKTGHPPFHVVVGSKVYKIDFKPDGRANYAKGRMGDVNEMHCIQGCQ